jgi:hypothetical protein
VRALLTDSIEVGAANWTPKMIEQFKALRGYDPRLGCHAGGRAGRQPRRCDRSSMTGAARWVI